LAFHVNDTPKGALSKRASLSLYHPFILEAIDETKIHTESVEPSELLEPQFRNVLERIMLDKPRLQG